MTVMREKCCFCCISVGLHTTVAFVLVNKRLHTVWPYRSGCRYHYPRKRCHTQSAWCRTPTNLLLHGATCTGYDVRRCTIMSNQSVKPAQFATQQQQQQQACAPPLAASSSSGSMQGVAPPTSHMWPKNDRHGSLCIPTMEGLDDSGIHNRHLSCSLVQSTVTAKLKPGDHLHHIRSFFLSLLYSFDMINA